MADFVHAGAKEHIVESGSLGTQGRVKDIDQANLNHGSLVDIKITLKQLRIIEPSVFHILQENGFNSIFACKRK